MNDNLQDRIDEYVLGHMSVEDKERFEEELIENKDLREQYNYTRLLKDTISEYAELQELMNQWDKDIEEEHDDEESFVAASAVLDDEQTTIPQKVNKKKILYWFFGVAAVLVIGLFMINPFFIESDFQYNSCIEWGSVRNAGNEFIQIDTLLINKKYNEALCKIDSLEKEIKISDIYDGINDTLDIELKEEIEYNKQVLKIHSDDLRWMKIYALLGLKRKSEAILLLEQLKSNEGFYKEKADSLYNILK